MDFAGLDPLAITAAALAGEAAVKKIAGDGSWEVLSKVVSWLSDRFDSDGDAEGLEALAKVEDAPDSPSRVEALAQHVNTRIGDEGFRDGLAAVVENAAVVGGEVGAFVVNVRDNATVEKSVQIGTVNTNTFNV